MLNQHAAVEDVAASKLQLVQLQRVIEDQAHEINLLRKGLSGEVRQLSRELSGKRIQLEALEDPGEQWQSRRRISSLSGVGGECTYRSLSPSFSQDLISSDSSAIAASRTAAQSESLADDIDVILTVFRSHGDVQKVVHDMPVLLRVEGLCIKVLAALRKLQLSLDSAPSRTVHAAPTVPPASRSQSCAAMQRLPVAMTEGKSQAVAWASEGKPQALPSASVGKQQAVAPNRSPLESTFKVPVSMQPRSMELQQMRELWSQLTEPVRTRQLERQPDQQPEQLLQQLQQRQQQSSQVQVGSQAHAAAQPSPLQSTLQKLVVTIPTFNATPSHGEIQFHATSPKPTPQSCLSACHEVLTSPRPLMNLTSPTKSLSMDPRSTPAHSGANTQPLSDRIRSGLYIGENGRGSNDSCSSSSSILEVNVSGQPLYVDVNILQSLQASLLYRQLVSESASSQRDPQGRIYLPYDSDCLSAIFAHLQELHLFGVSTANPSDWDTRFGPRSAYLKRLVDHLGLRDIMMPTHPLAAPSAQNHSPRNKLNGPQSQNHSPARNVNDPQPQNHNSSLELSGFKTQIHSPSPSHSSNYSPIHSPSHSPSHKLSSKSNQPSRFLPSMYFFEKQEIMLATMQPPKKNSSSLFESYPRQGDVCEQESFPKQAMFQDQDDPSPGPSSLRPRLQSVCSSPDLLPIAEIPRRSGPRAWLSRSLPRQ